MRSSRNFSLDKQLNLHLWVEFASGKSQRDARKKAQKKIHRAFFEGMKILDLSNMKLTSIDQIPFPKSIRTLNLSKNCLTSIDGVDLSGIETVIFRRNRIQTIENANFSRVKNLDFSMNQISSVSRTNFSFVQKVDFSNNNLTLSDFKYSILSKDTHTTFSPKKVKIAPSYQDLAYTGFNRYPEYVPFTITELFSDEDPFDDIEDDFLEKKFEENKHWILGIPPKSPPS